MTVGERIKQRREELGLSQGDLAKKMNVSRQAISKAELHDNNITTEKVSKFAKALNCTEALLTGWSDIADADESKRIESQYENYHNSIALACTHVGSSKRTE